MASRNLHRTNIDWNEVRVRLATAVDLTQATTSMSPERASGILHERARALARPKAIAASTSVVEVLHLNLGSQAYALELRYVREMRRVGSYCRVPGLPPHFLGLAALRGEMLAIVDLCLLLGMPASALGGDARLVVLGTAAPEFGIVAAGVERTGMLSTADLLDVSDPPGPEPDAGPGAGRFVRGVTREGVALLDGQALLADDRLFTGRQSVIPGPDSTHQAPAWQS